MGEERRKQARKKLDKLLEVLDINAENKLGRAVNISLDGIMILSRNELHTNKVWQLKMDLPSRTGKTHSVFFGAESLWCEASSEPGQFWSGLHVIEISKEDRETFGSFISGQL